jgi:hypothetical protein
MGMEIPAPVVSPRRRGRQIRQRRGHQSDHPFAQKHRWAVVASKNAGAVGSAKGTIIVGMN